jgi:hypothetical protein
VGCVVFDGQARIAPGTHVEAKKEAGPEPGASQAASGLPGTGRIASRAHVS